MSFRVSAYALWTLPSLNELSDHQSFPVLLPGFQGLLCLSPENTPYIEVELQLADLPFI